MPSSGSGSEVRLPRNTFMRSVMLLAFCVFLYALPAHVAASSLVWGNGDGSPPVQVEIVDGGTYTVPLNVQAPGYVSVDLSSGPVIVAATLYQVDDSGNKTQVTTLHFHDPNGDPQFAWPAAGSYELDISKLRLIPPAVNFNDRLMRWFAKILFSVAYAQVGVAPPPPSLETLHLTIKEACTQNCFDNVMFLPGIEASRLYDTDNGETKLWEPGSALQSGDADAQQLAMNPDGTSVRSDIYTRDILDNAYVPSKGNIYASFITDMATLKDNGTINDWGPIAYDWRLPLDQILSSGKVIDDKGDISYLDATDTPYIVQELKDLAATSKSGKVTVIAHSNGGLLAKALMEKLGSNASMYVDKIILVAVPQVGTPQAIAGLLHGYGQGFPLNAFPIALSQATARSIGDTMPGLYMLLPSTSYFTYVDDPAAVFDATTLPDWVSKYGDVIHSTNRLAPFLTDSSRLQPAANDLNNPTTLNSAFVSNAEAAHDDLDSWQAPAGVQIIQIAGWGVPTTVKDVGYASTTKPVFCTGICHSGLAPLFDSTVDGDGTVVAPSALWMSTSNPDVEDYWLNLEKYNGDTLHLLGKWFGFDHGDIFEVKPLRDFILDQITESSKSLSDYVYLSASQPVSTDHILRYALHSPLTLDLYDDQGNHTGVSTTTGEVEENIPGTYYVQFGDVKYIFADTGTPQHIVMSGYDTGMFTFDISELQGDSVVATTEFKDVPVTPETKVTLDVSSGLASASNLVVDENGDGTTDSTYASSTGDLIVPPTPQPTSPAPPSGGGGGGIPSLLPQATSTIPNVASTTTTATSSPPAEIDATASPIAAVSHASSSRPVAVVTHKKPAHSAPSAIASSTFTQQSQVAAAAQSTGSGLWKKVWGWIMKTLQSLI